MRNKLLILLIEDEAAITNFISAALSSNGYNVIKAPNGKDGVSMTASCSPDLIILDLGLPDIDGEDVIKNIRSWSSIPIIVVSARSHEREKVQALDSGVDDYIIKPFGISELLARIRTAVRHSDLAAKENHSEKEKMTIGDLSINYKKRNVKLAEKEVHFTPIEYKIIVLLSKNSGKVLTHDYIVKQIWGPYMNENQALRVNMANIRRKIEVNPAEPKYILTEVGVGYRMADEIN